MGSTMPPTPRSTGCVRRNAGQWWWMYPGCLPCGRNPRTTPWADALDRVRVDWLTRQADVRKAEELEGEMSAIDDKLQASCDHCRDQEAVDVAQLADRMKELNAERSKLQNELQAEQTRHSTPSPFPISPCGPVGSGAGTSIQLPSSTSTGTSRCVEVYPAGPQANADKYAQRLKEYAKKENPARRVYHTIRNRN